MSIIVTAGENEECRAAESEATPLPAQSVSFPTQEEMLCVQFVELRNKTPHKATGCSNSQDQPTGSPQNPFPRAETFYDQKVNG